MGHASSGGANDGGQGDNSNQCLECEGNVCPNKLNCDNCGAVHVRHNECGKLVLLDGDTSCGCTSDPLKLGSAGPPNKLELRSICETSTWADDGACIGGDDKCAGGLSPCGTRCHTCKKDRHGN